LPERIMVKVYTKRNREWQSFLDGDFEDTNRPYLDEMAHFINCIKGREKPLVDGSMAKQAVEIVLAAKESSESHNTIALR
ncbi:hypothetical protein ACFLXT_00715, partial [Chloroflexota bacterium]